MRKPKITTLANGVRVVVAPMPGVKSATVLALVQAGTRYERTSTNGISHFIEHAVSKGTKKLPTAMDVALAIDSIGGKNNAYTSKELTAYYVKSAAKDVAVALRVISELVFHPLLRDEDIEVERGVILEEIRMYEDNPQATIAREFEAEIFKGTRLGWKTLGSPQTVSALTAQHFREYMQYLYTPERMVVVVAGGVSDTIPQIGTYFNHQTPITEFQPERFNFSQKKARLKQVKKDTEQCHIVMGYRTFGRGHKDRYVLSVLSALLGGGMSSRLFTQVREKRGLAYYVGAYPNVYTESGYLAMVAGTKPATAQEVLTVAQQEFMTLTEKSVKQSELKKAKAYLTGHLVLGWEDSMQVAEFYGEDAVLSGKLRSQEEVLRGIAHVTPDDIQRLATSLFCNKHKTTAVIGPADTIAQIQP